MQTPYQILQLGIDASDEEIKRAYLKQVKLNPPDRDQERFQIIYNAYQAIKDHKSRVSYDLFTLPVANFEQLIDQALSTEQVDQITAKQFIDLLQVTIDDSLLLNSVPQSESK